MITQGWRPADALWMPFTAIITLSDEGEGMRYVATVMHPNPATRNKQEQMGFHEGWGTCIDQLGAFARSLA